MLTLTPGYTASQFITPYSGGGVYGKTLVNPSLGDYAPRVGFAYAVTPTIAIRGGYGTSFVHYTRAGSGDILPINAPSALFVSVTQPGTATAAGYRTLDQGYPGRPSEHFHRRAPTTLPTFRQTPRTATWRASS